MILSTKPEVSIYGLLELPSLSEDNISIGILVCQPVLEVMRLEFFLLAQLIFASAFAPQSYLAPSHSQVVYVKIRFLALCNNNECFVLTLPLCISFIEGGGYGLARVTLGFYFGFMVGCCEIIEYIIYTADTCLSISNIIIKSTGIDRKLSPLIWLIFYVSAVIIYCIGGKLFWRVSNLFAFLSLAILLIYFAGSFQFLDFQNTKYVTYSPVWPDPTGLIPPPPPPSNNTFFGNIAAVDNIGSTPGNPWFLGGPPEFMRVLPLAGWFYVGIESLNFAANDVNEVSRMITRRVIKVIKCDNHPLSVLLFFIQLT